MIEREFKGIFIPKDIYLSKLIGWHGKLIFLEIDSFTSKEKDCFFSNEYLAEFFQISVVSVSRYINRLIEIGWVEQTRFDGRKRYLRSCFDKAALSKVIRQDSRFRQGSINTFDNHNNTSLIIPVNKENINIKIENFESKEYKEFNRWLNIHIPQVHSLPVQLTEEQFFTLFKKYGTELLQEKLLYMENQADLKEKYRSVYLSINFLFKNKKQQKDEKFSNA